MITGSTGFFVMLILCYWFAFKKAPGQTRGFLLD